MARKSLQDLSGIAKTIAEAGSKTTDRVTKSSAPALGALQGSLSAIREIDPNLIDDWGPSDRLVGFTTVNSEEDDDGFATLVESIRDGGQQVPILVRRSRVDGRFEVIYGRRRLRACLELGIKVRGNVQELDDKNALLAKGLENAARRNLSFYEKARFAVEIQLAGHNTATVRQVLGLSKSGLSHLSKVSGAIPNEVGDAIGAAPKSGRPKWTSLSEAFLEKKISTSTALAVLSRLDENQSSDEKLEYLLREIVRRGARQTQSAEVTPVDGITIKSGYSTIAVSIKRNGKNAAFAEWLDQELEAIIKKSYQEFTAVNSTNET